MRFPCLVLALTLAIAAAGCSSACLAPAPPRIAVMSYNVDNLFDASDSGGEYPEFSVKSGRWDEARYRARLGLLAEVVRAAAPSGKGPDIACFMEVENRGVLEELRTGPLSSSGYRESVLVPAPGQAANCGILSRFPVTGLRAHGLVAGKREGRYILEARLDIHGRPLTLFVCHWKSKLEGAEATEGERRAAASLLASRIAGILAADPKAEFLACGDFNEGPDEYALTGGAYPTAFLPADRAAETDALCDFDGARPLLVAAAPEGAGSGAGGSPVLWSPWSGAEGWSYAIAGRRERIDGFLLPAGLLDGEGLSYEAFKVIDEDFLLGPEGLPWAYDPRKGSGYSDHLPILLTLSWRPPSGG